MRRQTEKTQRLQPAPGCSPAFLWGLAGCVLAVLALDTAFTYLNFYRFAYYDSSPELVLAKLLADENALLTTSWFYSTEIRVLNTQILNMLLMKVLSNWRVVKTLSVFLHLLLLEGSYLCFARQFHAHRRNLLLGAVLLLLPINMTHVQFVLEGEFYIPHLLLMFLALALFGQVRQTESKKTRVVCFVLELLVAVGSGMGGLRQFDAAYLPLTAAVVFCVDLDRQGKKQAAWDLLHVLSVLTAAGAGFLISVKVLGARYYFPARGDTSLMRVDFDRLEDVLDQLLISWGYDHGAALFSVRGIVSAGSVAAAVGIVLLALHVYRRQSGKPMPYMEKLVLLFTAFSWLAKLCTFAFVDIGYAARYFIPQNVMTVVAVLLLLPYCKKEYKAMAGCLLGGLLLLSSAMGAKIWLTEEDNTSPEFRQAVEYVREQGYRYGYVYQFGNALPELTDGQIDVYCVQDFKDMSPDKWLEKTSILELPSYTGKTFALVNREEYAAIKGYPHIESGTVGYENDQYVVIEFENNARMWALVPGSGDGA